MPLKLRSTLSFVNRFIDLKLKFSNLIAESYVIFKLGLSFAVFITGETEWRLQRAR